MDIQQNNGKQGVRTRHIDIRLTQKEYEAIVEKAAECGLTLSNYGRRSVSYYTSPSPRDS